jgi:hypothetical protein
MVEKIGLPKDESQPSVLQKNTSFINECKMTPVISLIEAWALGLIQHSVYLRSFNPYLISDLGRET